MYAYLNAIVRTWKYIIEPEVHPEQLDETTVLALQMYTPAYSSQDCNEIIELFVGNKVFPLVQNIRDRENICRRVLGCKRIVTLTSFFEDFIYLRTCFDGLRALLPPNWKDEGRSFKQAFAHNWKGHDVSNDDVEATGWHPETRPRTFEDCYVDMWLFGEREFPWLTDGKASQPLHDRATANGHIEGRGLVAAKQAQLAYKASHVGFETEEIERIKDGYPTEIPQDGPSPKKPELSCNDTPLRRKDRSNRPSRANYARDKSFLHRVYLYDNDMEAVERRSYATSYAIARDIVHCCCRPDDERWVRDVEMGHQTRSSDNEKSHTKGLRQPMTRPFVFDARSKQHNFDKAKYKVNKQRKARRTDRKALNDDLYEELVAETGTKAYDPFAATEEDSKIDTGSTVQNIEVEEPRMSPRQIFVKEEYDLPNGGLTGDSSRQSAPQNTDETPRHRSESSVYSTNDIGEVKEAEQHIYGELAAFDDEDDGESLDEPTPDDTSVDHSWRSQSAAKHLNDSSLEVDAMRSRIPSNEAVRCDEKDHQDQVEDRNRSSESKGSGLTSWNAFIPAADEEGKAPSPKIVGSKHQVVDSGEARLDKSPNKEGLRANQRDTIFPFPPSHQNTVAAGSRTKQEGLKRKRGRFREFKLKQARRG